MPIDAAIGVTDAGEDGARIPHDADVDATDGSMSRDAGDAG
jgi:hypothetical protein